ncbi:MAG: hypothetical protein NTU49_01360 [Gammaproteobacteria bacterium]|nr:hypothetical protein [Gammaproteobacteria bacterium]
MEDKKMDKHKKSECHKKIAGYLQEAAKLHLEAAKHCEADDCGKAAGDTLKAFGFICAAKKHVKKMAMHCAGIECCDGNSEKK